MIVFRKVKKSFGPKAVLDGVSFEVRPGECFFIIGASGVGKSVLIKHLVGLLAPDEGEIFLDGEEVSRLPEKAFYPVRKKCAMVFQNSTLFDSMTCLDNVALPLRKHKDLSPAAAREEAMRRLRQVHMERFAQSFPAELGDGMRKRVAIARAHARPELRALRRADDVARPGERPPRRPDDPRALRHDRRHRRRRLARPREHLLDRRPHRDAL